MQNTFNPLTGITQGLAGQVGNIGANPLVHGPSSSSSRYIVGASEYGQGEAETGSCRINTNSVYGFAELGPAPQIGHAFGGLPCGTKFRITNPKNGKSVIAEKVDVGAGGSPVEGLIRRIDLHYRTAQALGFNGTGKVVVERVNANGQTQPIDYNPSPNELFNPFDLGPFEHLGEKAGETLGGNPLAPFEKIAEAFKNINKFFELLTTPSGWLRIGKLLLGAILIIIALGELAKIGSGSSTPSVPAKIGVTI